MTLNTAQGLTAPRLLSRRLRMKKLQFSYLTLLVLTTSFPIVCNDDPDLWTQELQPIATDLAQYESTSVHENPYIAPNFNTHPVSVKPSTVNTYDTRPMVPQLIADAFCSQPAPQEVQDFYQQYKSVIDELLKTPFPTTSIGQTPYYDAQAGPVTQLRSAWRELFTAKMVSDKQRIVAAGMRNVSDHGYNYVFQTNDGNYFLKISGPLNRLCNMICYEFKEEIINRPPSDDALITICKHDTNQTLSRVACNLRLQELVNKGKVTHIKVPQSWVMKADPTKPISDENCIVIESKMTGEDLGLLFEGQSSAKLDQITDAHMKDLIRAIKYAGPYFMSGVKIDSDGNFVFCDTEQANRQARFFHMGGYRYPVAVCHCLTDATAIFQKHPGLFLRWKNAVRKDKEAYQLIQHLDAFKQQEAATAVQ